MSQQHIRAEILSLCERGDVEYQEYQEYEQLRMNSFEREFLYPYMTNDCLITVIENHILPNCRDVNRFMPAVTYDDSLIKSFVPLLLSRLKETT